MNHSKVDGNSWPHQLSWYIPGKVMLLTLSGAFTLSDAEQIQFQIMEWLESLDRPLFLVIADENAVMPRNFDQVRAAQRYMDDRRLMGIYVITTNKLTRLSMIVIYNLSRAGVQLFDDFPQLDKFLDARLDRSM